MKNMSRSNLFLSFAFLLLGSCGQSSTDEKSVGENKKDTSIVEVKVVDSVEVPIIQETILVPITDKYGFYGYQDSLGNWKIEPRFRFASNFSNGYAAVLMKPGLWTLIDSTEKEFVKFNNNGFTPLMYHNELSGEEEFAVFNEGMLPVQYKNGVGFFEVTTRTTSPVFEDIMYFSEGLAPAMKNGKWGFINREFEWEIDPEFENVYSISDNRALVKKNGWCWYIDKKLNNYCFDKKFIHGFRFKEGLTFITYDDNYMNYVLIDTTGKVINKGPFENVYNLGFENGECEVFKNGKCIIIDKKGNKIREKKEGCQDGC